MTTTSSEAPKSKYRIFVGYVKKFEYLSPQIQEYLSGHPHTGRVYRIIENDGTYRLHIGGENNKSGLEGLSLGHTLSGTLEGFYSFDITEITNENYFDFKITDSDFKKMMRWLEIDNADLDTVLKIEQRLKEHMRIPIQDNNHAVGSFKKEDSGDEETHSAPLSKEFLQDNGPTYQGGSDEIGKEAAEERLVPVGQGSVDLPDEIKEFMANLDFLDRKDPMVIIVLMELVKYLVSTYGEKYESAGENIGKLIVTRTSLGKGANVFNTIKYMQRYGTDGFDKSNNIKDLYKAIHYVLFELQRRKNMDE